MTIASDVTGVDTAPITSVRIGAEVTFRFQHTYDLTDPEWQQALHHGTQTFMNKLETQIRADIRDEISSQVNLSQITMNFHRKELQ